MIIESIPMSSELYDKIKMGEIHTINVNGYNDIIYTYELVKIEKKGKVYKLERDN